MNPMLTGLHHLTAVTARAGENFAFYTQTLGMRLVKKTVNQDDVRAYHLFYGDGVASPGSDITFFDWPDVPQEQRGSHTITRTGLRAQRSQPRGGQRACRSGCQAWRHRRARRSRRARFRGF